MLGCFLFGFALRREMSQVLHHRVGVNSSDRADLQLAFVRTRLRFELAFQFEFAFELQFALAFQLTLEFGEERGFVQGFQLVL